MKLSKATTFKQSIWLVLLQQLQGLSLSLRFCLFQPYCFHLLLLYFPVYFCLSLGPLRQARGTPGSHHFSVLFRSVSFTWKASVMLFPLDHPGPSCPTWGSWGWTPSPFPPSVLRLEGTVGTPASHGLKGWGCLPWRGGTGSPRTGGTG